MKTILTVLTSPRPQGGSYLSETIDQLDEHGASGCDEKWIVTDGIGGQLSVGTAQRRWNVLRNPQRTGNRLAWWRCLQLAREREADWLISCEDDLLVAPGAIAKVLSEGPGMLTMERALLTYFDARAIPEGSPAGVYDRPCYTSESDAFCGAQCMLIPRRTVEYLLTCDPLECPVFRGSFHTCDCVMGWFLAQSPWPTYGIVLPTLVDHRGDKSAAAERKHNRPVRGRNFAGERDPVYKEMHAPFYVPRK